MLQTPNCHGKEIYPIFYIRKIQIHKVFTMIIQKIFTHNDILKL